METMVRLYNLITAKLAAPMLPVDFVETRCCTRFASERRRMRVVSVVAPTGYGKTVLLAYGYRQCVDAGSVALWVQLDDSDDGVVFWAYVAQALADAIPDLDCSFLEDCAAACDVNDPEWVNPLINQLASIESDVCLFIDGFHHVSDPKALKAFERFIRYMPERMHVIMSSRENIALPLAYLRLQGRMALIERDDLSLDAEEVKSCLETWFGQPVGDDDAAEIAVYTQGWVMGVKIAAEAMGEDAFQHDVLPASTDEDVRAPAYAHRLYRYLDEEVFQQLDEGARHFLEDTSVLDSINASLADCVLGIEDSADYLVRFERAHLLRLDASSPYGWFQLSPLMRGFLQSRLLRKSKNEVDELHRRAASWLADNGFLERSIAHSISCGEYETALERIEQVYWVQGMRYSYSSPVMDLLAHVPFEMLRKHPRCLRYYIIVLFVMGAGGDFDRLVAHVRAGDAFEGEEEDALTARDLRDRCLVNALIAYADGDYATALSCIDDALMRSYFDSYRADGLMCLFAARCHFALGQTQQCFDRLSQSIVNARAHRMTEECLMASFELARVKMDLGFIDEADRIMRTSLTYARQNAYRGVMAGILRFGQASSAFERGRIDEVRTYLAENGDFIEQQRQSFEVWICAPDFFFHVAAFYLWVGDLELAEEYVACAKDYLKLSVDVPLLPEAVTFLRLHIWGLADDDAKIVNWLKAHKVHGIDEDGFESACRLMSEAYAFAAIGKIRSALHTLEARIPSDAQLPFSGFRIEYHIMKAFCFSCSYAADQARNQMAIALRLGSRFGQVKEFLLWGPWVAPLAGAISQQAHANGDDTFASFVDQVADLCQGYWEQAGSVPGWLQRASVGAGEELSKREIEILECLVARMTLSEVAQSQGISKNTVKTHVQSIYRKLGVGDRMAAIEAARRLLDL